MAEEIADSARDRCTSSTAMEASTPAETFLVHGRTKFPHINI